MTEQDYINTSDKVRISVAKESLMNVVAENSPVIDKEEYDMVMQALSRWERKLFDVIKLEEA